MDSLTDFSHFSARGYLPLIRKDSVTHMHGLADYLKERYTFALDLPLRLDCVKSVHIFPHLDWIRKNTDYLSVFSPNAGKNGAGKLWIRTFFLRSINKKITSFSVLLFFSIDHRSFLFTIFADIFRNIRYLREIIYRYPEAVSKKCS